MLRSDPISFLVWCLLVSFCLFYTDPVFAGDIQVLKISPENERALIRDPEGRNQILKVGDRIGDHGKVVEIAEGRVVIEERTDQGAETVIIRFEKGTQRVERIRKMGDKLPIPYSPSPKEENQPVVPSR